MPDGNQRDVLELHGGALPGDIKNAAGNLGSDKEKEIRADAVEGV